MAPPAVPTAHAQQAVVNFPLDLERVSRLFDTLYHDRVTGEYEDSTVVYDWNTVRFGNQRSRIPAFLTTDAAATRQVDDFLVLPGYRVRFVVPQIAYFESAQKEVGELTIRQERDLSVPGLEIEIASMDAVATEIMQQSRAELWRQSARASVTTLPITTGSAQEGGIKFEIPLPMPKTLESIFGPGEKTSITIRGREEITIAGETTVRKPFIGVEGRQSQSLFPSLDMQQKLDVSLQGTIGDKVSIQVDHSSDALADNANRVRLAYTGYEDEVIQSVELGSTSLSLPGSQLVSVSTNAQGLFGIKITAKMGSTDFTMIASKQEGEVSSALFTPIGGALGQTETRVIRDVDYVRNKYFYLDDPASFVGADLQGLEVYRTVTAQDLVLDPTIPRTPGWAIPDRFGDGGDIQNVVNILNLGQAPPDSLALHMDFKLLDRGVDYDFILDAQTEEVVGIELFDPIPDAALKALAVRYLNRATPPVPIGGSFSSYGIPGPGGQPIVPGSEADELVLEMIKAPNPRPVGPYDSTWRLMFRNIYNLGLTNLDGNSLEVTIEDIINPRLNPDVPEGSDVPYLRIFGLDRTDLTGTGPPDGRIDLTFGVVDLTSGILQFPSIHAFAPDTSLVGEWTEGQFQFTGEYSDQYMKSERIYNELLNSTQEADVHQYDIRISAVSTSKTFTINAFNIVENSENISIDGTKLNRGVDYEIDYETGEVTLKEGALARLTPDSRVSVDYQFKPLGGVASSTLAGMSSTSKLGENARLGTTFLYESKNSTADRPRLGEEPTRAVVGGITGSYQHESRVLTDIANWLPYVDTDAPSTFQVDGELAASFPNPNTKDKAYIDDFEGIEDSDRITMSRRAWYPASAPVGKAPADSSRLKEFWYNIDPSLGVHRKDLNPNLDKSENTLVQSLDIELDSNPSVADSARYAGVMIGFAGGGLDFSQGQFLEIWVNDFQPNALNRRGKIHIDTGIIDENFFEMEKAQYNDEDKNRDGFAAAFDDTGLDGLFNMDEGAVKPGGNAEDPNGDDIDTARIGGRYLKVNGTEGNQLYDTEDLDRNGQMTRDNAYFSYTIDLADTAEIDIRELYPNYEGFGNEGHQNDAWRLYRIKLKNYSIVSPRGIEPRLDEIRHLRIWFDNADGVVRTDSTGARRIQICEFSVRGNRWEADGVRDLSDTAVDTTGADFAIGVISNKTDPGVYNPPSVPNKENQVYDKESSLALRYTGLSEGIQLRILKRFTQGINLTLYRDLNFWVHTDSVRSGAEYYFRMGSNEQNYYEIQVPFTGAFYNQNGWARVVVSLADLTNLKFETPDSVVVGTAVDLADPSRAYPVLMQGIPSLTGVRFLYAGVRNRSNPAPQAGEIWMDDIYCSNVMRDFDHAERVSANLSLAGGALSIGGNWSRTGADYRGLRQTRGSGADQTNYGINARTDLQYFLPLAGFSLPVSGSYTHAKSLPKFPPNSDTEIKDPVVVDSLRTERIGRGFSTSLSRRAQSNNILMRYSLDRLKPTFAYSESRGISPASRDTSTSMTGGLAYQVTWSAPKTVPLFGNNRLRWWPNSFDFSSTATRQTAHRWSLRNGEFKMDPIQYRATLVSQGTVRYSPFQSLESSYGMTVNRDAALEHEWLGVNIGQETARTSNLRLAFIPPKWPVFRLFDPSIEVQSGYSENSSPNVRREGDPEGTRNVSETRNTSGRLRFDFSRHIKSVFNWMGWDPEGNKKGATPPPIRDENGGAETGGGARALAPAGTAAPDSTTRRRPGIGTLFGGIGRMLTRVQPINGNVQHQTSSGYSRLATRPSYAYRLGWTSNSGLVAPDGTPISVPDQEREDFRYNFHSSVRLKESNEGGQNIDLQARFARGVGTNNFRASRTRSANMTWPDLQLKWDNLQAFRPLKPILSNGQLTVDYRQTHNETGPADQPPISITESLTFSPALTFTWKNELNSGLGVSYGKNTSESRSVNSTVSGSKSVTTNFAVNLDLRKNFRAGGGFSLFGKGLKWNNELESTLVVTYAKTGGERFNQGSIIPQPIPSTTSIRVGPTVRYYFSKNVSGSGFVDYSHVFTQASNVTTTTVRVGITALVNF